ncbi:MAG: (2Fe-2S) ferredoxin domain-containing protein [Thermoplasmatota archaeon]
MDVEPASGVGRRFVRHAFVCVNHESCALDGSEQVHRALKDALRQAGLKESLRVNKSGCLGQCGHGPMVVVYPEGVWYSHVTPEDAPEIWQSHMLDGHPVERLRYRTENAGTNVIPKRGGPPGPDNPIATASPFWSPCTRCPASWSRAP